MKKVLVALLGAGMMFSHATLALGGTDMVESGKQVKFNYTLTVNGEVVDTSDGREPLQYTHGSGQIIKGLEAELEGMKVGDKKSVTIAPADAYGEVDENAVREFPLSMFPEDVSLQPGMILPLQDDQGNTMNASVMEVAEETVKLNFNHPLAGQSLNFDVEIVEVQ